MIPGNGSLPWPYSGIARAAMAVLAISAASAQIPMPGVGDTVHLVNADQAILESQVVRKDLPCEVRATDTFLGFDLRFHTGYEVTLPLEELSGEGNMLNILLRITPEGHERNRVYLAQRIPVPSIRADADGKTTLPGIFDLGAGKYHIDWMMRDRSERVCSDYWDTEAKLSGRDQDLVPEIAPGVIEAASFDQFVEDPPVRRATGHLLNVKLLVNFAPQDQKSSAMRPIDTLALVTMLRRISREPQFGRFSIAAFNIQDQRVVYRQYGADRIDFPALGRAIQDIEPGTVDLALLKKDKGEVEFLVNLIETEMGGLDRPDAVIFAGPKYLLDDSVPEDQLERLREAVDFPVFYLNYNLIPQQVPWRDAIGRAIRVFDGKEFTITRPRDLWFAVAEIVSRIVESNQGEEASFRP